MSVLGYSPCCSDSSEVSPDFSMVCSDSVPEVGMVSTFGLYEGSPDFVGTVRTLLCDGLCATHIKNICSEIQSFTWLDNLPMSTLIVPRCKDFH